jgi:hypothetical protein
MVSVCRHEALPVQLTSDDLGWLDVKHVIFPLEDQFFLMKNL